MTQAAAPEDAQGCRRLAEELISRGQLSEAAAVLESGAGRFSNEAHDLYRSAAWLRERRGELGQALLDYRAMLHDTSDKDRFSRHLAYLSLAVDKRQQFAGLPLTKELNLERTFPGWAEKQRESAAGRPPTDASSWMPLPGGARLVAAIAGIDATVLSQPDAVQRLFSFIVDAAPAGAKPQENAVRKDLLAYLKDYRELMEYLEEERLLPLNFDPAKPQPLCLPLVGTSEDVSRARRLLSFFGVGYKLRSSPRGPVIELRIKEGREASKRQGMLRAMGVNVLDPNLREIRIPFENGQARLLGDSAVWSERILSDKDLSKPLLQRFVENPEAMTLYLALADCTEATRDALLRQVTPEQLLKCSDALRIFGAALDFTEGKLALPGSQRSWEELLGVPFSDARFLPTLLTRDSGRALLFYSALKGAPAPVAAYLTSSPSRLGQLYSSMAPYDSGRLVNMGVILARQDLGRIFRMLRVDAAGLLLNIDGRFGRSLFHRLTDSGPGAVRVEPKDLPSLLESPLISRPTQPFSMIDFVEFLKYIQKVRPAILDERTIPLLMRDPFAAPVYLELVWDIDPTADQLVRYLQYCQLLAAADRTGWNVNRTRSSQATFFLLAALRRSRALTQEQARTILDESLDVFSAGDEGRFAAGLAALFSGRWLPSLAAFTDRRGDPGGQDEIVLRALAGSESRQRFFAQGKELEIDLPAYRLQRMKQAIQQQSYTPASVLLRLFAALAGSDADPKALQALLKQVQTARLKEDSSKELRAIVAHVDLPRLDQKVQSSRADAAQLANRLSAELHTELGVTLLTYCYAYAGSAEIDALAFDPNFVRKHAFYGVLSTIKPGWMIAAVEQHDAAGSLLIGSLAGLAFELSRLETAQSVWSFGSQGGKDLVPTLLFTLRHVPASLRSDRAQEYVALNAKLGREAVCLASLDPALNRWLDEYVAAFVSPRRRERIRLALNFSDPLSAAGNLSPSELFLLGEGYFRFLGAMDAGAVAASAGNQAAPTAHDPFCPVVSRLKELSKQTAPSDAARFRAEIDQYGVLLRRRLGLAESSFGIVDSYEALEKSARDEVLFERICDLKIRLAELNYELGIPAYVAEMQSELAVREVLPKTPAVRTSSWHMAVSQIESLRREAVASWMDELLHRGTLSDAFTAAAK
jgi:hypothetical protein